MGILEDVVKALERIPAWRRLSALPAEVDALRARVQALEDRLAGNSGKLCPLCNSPDFRVIESKNDSYFGHSGVMTDTYHCSACQHTEKRQRNTIQGA